MDPVIGQIFMFGGNYAPYNYAICNGVILPTNQYNALFAILGNAYGGDGVVSFGLPNLKGRFPIGPGQGPGLDIYVQRGALGGAFRTTLTTANLPAHSHAAELKVAPTPTVHNSTEAEQGLSMLTATPEGGVFQGRIYGANDLSTNPFVLSTKTVSVDSIGESPTITHYPPLICINYIVCTSGLFPARN